MAVVMPLGTQQQQGVHEGYRCHDARREEITVRCHGKGPHSQVHGRDSVSHPQPHPPGGHGDTPGEGAAAQPQPLVPPGLTLGSRS